MGLLFLCIFVCLAVVCFHKGLKVFHVFLGEGRFVVIIVVVEEHGEHVGHGLALWITHDVDGGIDAFSHQLVFQQVAATVASDDAANLPEVDVVEELTAGDSDFAH